MTDRPRRTCLDLVEPTPEPISEPDGRTGSITVYPDGPLLVRGVRITTPDGTVIPNERHTVALCRCGKSAIKPWCDGTHKIAKFSAPPPPAGDQLP